MNNGPRLSRALVLPALSLAFLTLTGCGINAPIINPAATSSQTRITGTLHGGQQPIAFSTIQLWSAGASG